MSSVEDGNCGVESRRTGGLSDRDVLWIGADAFSSDGLRRLFEVKGREPGRPVGLIAADAAMAFSVAREVSIVARRLADAFWPGPLTIVMPARDQIAPRTHRI